jgi:asparagine synthase (glutamine-hydrolysing)
MCGIAGRYHQVALPADPSWGGRADALLAHRGPDGSGHYLDERCELVHRRLALIDLSPTGAQPMANEDGGVWVVCNGEIYNHRELRSELRRRGHVFRGTSDTEVLVHLYEEHGAEMVNHLRGMFAFAVYDRARRRLVLARDPFGIKPLYYARHDGQWVFASEMKAILALRDFQPQLDRQACYDFLGLTYIPEPATGFANIFALPKGTSLTVGEGGRTPAPVPFQPLRAQPQTGIRMTELADAVGEKLLEAVGRQSVADVPVAALLSGGIDSSLVVAAYTRAARGESPATFNVRFPDGDYDETAMALAVSRHCGTTHRTIELEGDALTPESILELLTHFDQPFADTSLIPMYRVSRAIRERGIVCALSGDGGDEVFGGYGRFWRANQLVQLMRLPRLVQRAASGAGRFASGRTRDFGRQVVKAVQLARAGQSDSAVLIAGLSNYLSEEQKRELILPDAGAQLRPVYRHFDGYQPPGVSDLEELSRRMTEKLFAVSLPGDMLRKVDMMSMRAGIEVRVPMLDEEMAALGLSLSHGMKTDGRTGKLVLRELARRWLPARVARHPKHGFGVPLDRMLPQSFQQLLRDLLLAPGARVGAFLDMTVVGRWLDLFEQARRARRETTISREGLYQRVFIVLALELWMREHNLSW